MNSFCSNRHCQTASNEILALRKSVSFLQSSKLKLEAKNSHYEGHIASLAAHFRTLNSKGHISTQPSFNPPTRSYLPTPNTSLMPCENRENMENRKKYVKENKIKFGTRLHGSVGNSSQCSIESSHSKLRQSHTSYSKPAALSVAEREEKDRQFSDWMERMREENEYLRNHMMHLYEQKTEKESRIKEMTRIATRGQIKECKMTRSIELLKRKIEEKEHMPTRYEAYSRSHNAFAACCASKDCLCASINEVISEENDEAPEEWEQIEIHNQYPSKAQSQSYVNLSINH